MAYTGTGTEADPYLVSDFDSLKTCVAISGAYVKVISGIDAEMNDMGAIACRSLYADELTEIINIHREEAVAVDITGSSAQIKNINFKDMIFWPTATSGYNVLFRGSSASNTAPTIENCEFSMQGNARNTCLIFSTGYMNIDNSAVYAQFERTADPGSCSTDLAGAGCNIEKSVLDLYGLAVNSSMCNWNFNCHYCTLKIEASIAPLSYQRQIFTSDSHHNILILKNTTSTETANNPYNVNGLTVMDADNSDKINATGTSLYTVTEAQAKSEEYLRSINFVP